MRKWKITIRAIDEAKALEFIEMLTSGFRVADKIKEPFEHMTIEEEDKRQSLTCKLVSNK